MQKKKIGMEKTKEFFIIKDRVLFVNRQKAIKNAKGFSFFYNYYILTLNLGSLFNN